MLLVLARRLLVLTQSVCSIRALSMACSQSAVRGPVVNVRQLPGEEHMNLCLVYGQKQLNMQRLYEEPLGKALKRLLLSVSKPDKKTRKKKGDSTVAPLPTVHAHLYKGQVCEASLLSHDTLNRDAWVDGSLLVLGDTTYVVYVNVPAVLSLSLPTFALVGGAIVPEVELEFTEPSSCQWVWHLLSESCDSPPSTEDLSQCPVVSTSMSYWPSPEDAGRKILVQCTPSSSRGLCGSPVTAISPLVMDMPPDTPITRRQLYTPSRLESKSQFRVVTYNTLAEPFSKTEFAQTVLYPYCDPTALHIHYRQSLIARELLGYNADIICLQEVGTKMYQRYLQCAMEDKGYQGVFTEKGGQMPEGEAIFFDASKFSLIASESTLLRSFLQTHPSCEQLARGLSTAPLFLDQVLRKQAIVMSVLLQSRNMPNHYLLVATTHLYYHPRGDHVRLMQVAVLIKFLESRLETYRDQLGQEATIATMICGDFNSCPCIGAYEYVVKGLIPSSHPDWSVYKLADIPPCKCALKQQRVLLEEEEDTDTLSTIETLPPNTASNEPIVDNFNGLQLEHSFHFSNVCGTEQFTNYTQGFKGVLDYIFTDSDHLSTVRTIPLPSLSELSEFVALPSIHFPSDHISLVADLEWNVI